MARPPRILPFVQKPQKPPAPKPAKDDRGGLKIRVTVERPGDHDAE